MPKSLNIESPKGKFSRIFLILRPNKIYGLLDRGLGLLSSLRHVEKCSDPCNIKGAKPTSWTMLKYSLGFFRSKLFQFNGLGSYPYYPPATLSI